MLNVKDIARIAAVASILAAPAAQSALIEVFSDGAAVTTLARADALIAAGHPVATEYRNFIEYDDLGDGTRGNFSVNNPFPGGLTSQFALRVSGSFELASAMELTLEVNHDDGMYLLLNGIERLFADGVVDNRNSAFTIALDAGVHSLQIVFFERLGGASLELASRDALGNRYLFELNDPIAVPEPAALALLGLSLLGFGLARRRRLA